MCFLLEISFVMIYRYLYKLENRPSVQINIELHLCINYAYNATYIFVYSKIIPQTLFYICSRCSYTKNIFLTVGKICK